jgi:hypothetical protein
LGEGLTQLLLRASLALEAVGELVERLAEATYDAPGPDGGGIVAYISDSVRIDADTQAELIKG